MRLEFSAPLFGRLKEKSNLLRKGSAEKFKRIVDPARIAPRTPVVVRVQEDPTLRDLCAPAVPARPVLRGLPTRAAREHHAGRGSGCGLGGLCVIKSWMGGRVHGLAVLGGRGGAPRRRRRR
jgi:hypothetical protein